MKDPSQNKILKAVPYILSLGFIFTLSFILVNKFKELSWEDKTGFIILIIGALMNLLFNIWNRGQWSYDYFTLGFSLFLLLKSTVICYNYLFHDGMYLFIDKVAFSFFLIMYGLALWNIRRIIKESRVFEKFRRGH
ncbi:hypothetical protein [Paenibacillus sp.]|uniref:hypothetical protein n=1 Tax=Paenibacillus sp. TaxID=58172 RepID=UPI002D4BCCA0|nr:hypothetical protein [Paenibacillus sp.]HZG86693.1 hypothetical protein [Paenibacillus sp.]